MFVKKKLFTLIMVLAFIVGMLPSNITPTVADDDIVIVYGQDSDVLENFVNNKNTTIVLQNNARVEMLEGFEINDCRVTFEGNGSVIFPKRLVVTGDSELIINTGVATRADKGISVNEGNSLTIDGEGSIYADGSDAGAGIGADNEEDCGDITINNGNLTVLGGIDETSSNVYGHAAIGGVDDGSNIGTITINGGNVTTYAGGRNVKENKTLYGAAAIGGGNGNGFSQININGGFIKAYGGECAASIGSGNDPWIDTTSINITGGTVFADKNIGGSGWHNSYEYVYISVTGGKVTARNIGFGTNLTNEAIANITLGWSKPGDYIHCTNPNGMKNATSIKILNDFYMNGKNPCIALAEGDLLSDTDPFIIMPKAPIVTLDADGGDVNIEKTVCVPDEDNFVVSELPTPSQIGYVFVGWFDKDNNKINVGDILAKDTTLVAKWDKMEETTTVAETTTTAETTTVEVTTTQQATTVQPTTEPASVKKAAKIKLKLTKIKRIKKSKKSLVLKAILKIDGKPVKGKKVTFRFKGKKYTAKTNKKGVAKVKIKKKVLKKLKAGKKVVYSASYGKKTVKKKAKVVK